MLVFGIQLDFRSIIFFSSVCFRLVCQQQPPKRMGNYFPLVSLFSEYYEYNGKSLHRRFCVPHTLLCLLCCHWRRRLWRCYSLCKCFTIAIALTLTLTLSVLSRFVRFFLMLPMFTVKTTSRL